MLFELSSCKLEYDPVMFFYKMNHIIGGDALCKVIYDFIFQKTKDNVSYINIIDINIISCIIKIHSQLNYGFDKVVIIHGNISEDEKKIIYELGSIKNKKIEIIFLQ